MLLLLLIQAGRHDVDSWTPFRLRVMSSRRE